MADILEFLRQHQSITAITSPSVLYDPDALNDDAINACAIDVIRAQNLEETKLRSCVLGIVSKLDQRQELQATIRKQFRLALQRIGLHQLRWRGILILHQHRLLQFSDFISLLESAAVQALVSDLRKDLLRNEGDPMMQDIIATFVSCAFQSEEKSSREAQSAFQMMCCSSDEEALAGLAAVVEICDEKVPVVISHRMGVACLRLLLSSSSSSLADPEPPDELSDALKWWTWATDTSGRGQRAIEPLVRNVGVAAAVEMLERIFATHKICWKVALAVIRIVVGDGAGQPLLLALIDNLVTAALSDFDPLKMTEACICYRLVSQISRVPTYDQWLLDAAFARASTPVPKRSARFVLSVLTQLAPVDSPEFLRLHSKILSKGNLPRSMASALSDMIKTRLDFVAAGNSGATGEKKGSKIDNVNIDSAVETLVDEYATQGKIPEQISRAQIFSRAWLLEKFLPALLSSCSKEDFKKREPLLRDLVAKKIAPGDSMNILIANCALWDASSAGQIATIAAHVNKRILDQASSSSIHSAVMKLVESATSRLDRPGTSILTSSSAVPSTFFSDNHDDPAAEYAEVERVSKLLLHAYASNVCEEARSAKICRGMHIAWVQALGVKDMIDPIVKRLTSLAMGGGGGDKVLEASQLAVVAALLANLGVHGPKYCQKWCLEIFSSLPLDSVSMRAQSLSLCVFYLRACKLYVGDFQHVATLDEDGGVVLLGGGQQIDGGGVGDAAIFNGSNNIEDLSQFPLNRLAPFLPIGVVNILRWAAVRQKCQGDAFDTGVCSGELPSQVEHMMGLTDLRTIILDEEATIARYSCSAHSLPTSDASVTELETWMDLELRIPDDRDDTADDISSTARRREEYVFSAFSSHFSGQWRFGGTLGGTVEAALVSFVRCSVDLSSTLVPISTHRGAGWSAMKAGICRAIISARISDDAPPTLVSSEMMKFFKEVESLNSDAILLRAIETLSDIVCSVGCTERSVEHSVSARFLTLLSAGALKTERMFMCLLACLTSDTRFSATVSTSPSVALAIAKWLRGPSENLKKICPSAWKLVRFCEVASSGRDGVAIAFREATECGLSPTTLAAALITRECSNVGSSAFHRRHDGLKSWISKLVDKSDEFGGKDHEHLLALKVLAESGHHSSESVARLTRGVSMSYPMERACVDESWLRGGPAGDAALLSISDAFNGRGSDENAAKRARPSFGVRG